MALSLIPILLFVGGALLLRYFRRGAQLTSPDFWERARGLPPNALRAVIQKENPRHDTLAVNPPEFRENSYPRGSSDAARGGAWGLCQITYTTALTMAQEMIARGEAPLWKAGESSSRQQSMIYPPEGLFEVATNLQLASFYLGKLYQQSGDTSPREAFRAYNGRSSAAQLYADDAMRIWNRLNEGATA